MVALDGASAAHKECDSSMSRVDESLSTVGRFLAPPLPHAAAFAATTSSDNTAASSRTDATTTSSLLSALSSTVPTAEFALPAVVPVERDVSCRSADLPSLSSPSNAAPGGRRVRTWLYDSVPTLSNPDSASNQSSSLSAAGLDATQRPSPERPVLDVPATLLPEAAQLDLDGESPFGDLLRHTACRPTLR